jgi:hypothetical protein
MKPLSRKPVSKGKSSRQFKRNVSRTKGANMMVNPMRGGWRL